VTIDLSVGPLWGVITLAHAWQPPTPIEDLSIANTDFVPSCTRLERGARLNDILGSGDVVLEGVNIAKRFSALVALDNVSVKLRRGEVTALVGDNGAGKSTLVNVLSGAIRPDSGRIIFRGEDIHFSGPRDARQLGIETIWQNLSLSKEFDVASNIYLGRELVYASWLGPLAPLNRRAMASDSRLRVLNLGSHISQVVGKPVKKLSGGQQQAVAVARAAGWATQVLFMDEPTAALGVRQSAKVLDVARRVAERGCAVLIISHSIPLVLEVADIVIVLRHGHKVAEMPVREATPKRLVALIVGLEVQDGE
jgi:simple sugar transport system ATP-binding protein